MNDEVLRSLLAQRLASPHSVLGAHPAHGDVFFRVYRPDAREVKVHVEGKIVPLTQRADFPGVFEGRHSKAKLASDRKSVV